jgi:AraC-like DNA-binding protein
MPSTATPANRSIIVDIGARPGAGRMANELFERPFAPLGPASRKLIEFMALMAAAVMAATARRRRWCRAGCRCCSTPSRWTRRARHRAWPRCCARIEAEPGLAWTTESMAKALGCSVSRLHALFREELDASPHAWLLEHRLGKAREWLASTAVPIAEIALRAGFSEQSALTRALRKATGMTPAAYRRQHRPAWLVSGSREQVNL